MANPNRTVYDGPPLSGPGLIWSNSKVTAIDLLSPELFEKWYEEKHIPDVLGTAPEDHGVVASWRYRCLDPTRDAPYLALYSVPDLSFIQTDEFKSIPQKSDMLPGGGPVHNLANFDTRFYRRVQVYEKPGAARARAPLVISVCLEPGDGLAEEVDRWYREEHLEQLRRDAPGWRRSTRFELVYKVESKSVPPEKRVKAPRWLALHEFEESTLEDGPMMVKPLIPQTDWTKKMIASMIQLDAAKFKLIKGFGNTEAHL
ncbi:hypothetical protein NA57DRAFT_74761 [Rhizodiscina lignyota]|uniref:Uncharacterized protein n=1 Tax=Rhizodiscina lignyota TaxID=1504668 RepID=A0A9P4IIU0_9PEZI|nr:hypothetical protein NA57DRAFT_74761 [Rhizodiscina lignyota]